MNSVRLNNRAVYALVQGNLKRANALLDRALQDFYENLGEEEDEEGMTMQHPRRIMMMNQHQGLRSVPLHHELCAYDLTFSPENSFEIYNQAFFLPLATDTDGEDPTHLERDEVASVLLCNFGLVLLKRGILEGKRRAVLLNKSLQIYQMAVSFLQDEAMMLHHRGDDNQMERGLRLLQLAAWANLGFIHSHHMEYNKVVNCKDHIKGIIITTTQDNNHNNGLINTTLPSSPDFAFFLHTVIHMEVCGLPRDVSPAA